MRIGGAAMADCATYEDRRELARRTSYGIDVSLDWCAREACLRVMVVDAAANSAFELVVGDANPLDVFNHPYAYAAFRGIDPAPAAAGSTPRTSEGG
jgi:hypothetical protein